MCTFLQKGEKNSISQIKAVVMHFTVYDGYRHLVGYVNVVADTFSRIVEIRMSTAAGFSALEVPRVNDAEIGSLKLNSSLKIKPIGIHIMWNFSGGFLLVKFIYIHLNNFAKIIFI